MNDLELEGRLRDLYAGCTPTDSTRAVAGMGRAIELARERTQVRVGVARGWRAATITGRHPYRILAAVTALAAVAVLALVVLPLWRGPAIGPAGTGSGIASTSPTASATPDLTPPPPTPTLGPAKCESSPPETFYQAVAWLDSKVVVLADHFVGCDLHQELLAVDPAAGTVRSIVGLSDVVSQISSDGSSIAVPTADGLFVIDASGKRRDLKLSADALKDLTWYDSLRPLPGGGYLIGGGSKLYRIASDGSRLTTDALPAGYVAVAPTSDPNLFILTPTEDAGGPYALSVKAPYRAYLWDLRKGSPKLVASDVGSVEKAPDSLAYLETGAAGPDGGTSFPWLSLAADGTVTPIAHLANWNGWVSPDGSLYLYVADQSTSASQTVELRETSTEKVLASYRGAVTVAVWRGNVVAVMGKTETGADELVVLDGASVTHVAMP